MQITMRGCYQQIADCARSESYAMMRIIVDDIGYVQQSRQQMQVLFTLMADRYEGGSLMITSNLPFSKWEQIFKDLMVTAAAIDRLVNHSVILELGIESYRMQVATKNKSKKPDGPQKGSI